MLGYAHVPILVRVSLRLGRGVSSNRLNRMVCLHTFIERVIHSIRVLCLGMLMFRSWCLFLCALVEVLVPIDFH